MYINSISIRFAQILMKPEHAYMDLDIGGAGRVMQGDPDPPPLENSNF